MLKEKGFTLIEMSIVLIVLALIGSAVISNLAPMIDFNKRMQTQTIMDQFIKALGNVYISNQYAIENNNTNNLTVSVGTNTLTVSNNTFSNAPGMNLMLGFMDDGTNSIVSDLSGGTANNVSVGFLNDAFSNPFKIFVSNPLYQLTDGIPIFYKKVYIISSLGIVDAAGIPDFSQVTYDAATDTLTVSNNSNYLVSIFNGFSYALNAYNTTKARQTNLASAYETFFNSRFLASADKEVDVDYFAAGAINTGWDYNSALPWGINPVSVNASFDVKTDSLTSGQKLFDLFGMSIQDSINGWGSDIILDNASSFVRNPNNPSASKTTAPFTAQFYSKIPDPTNMAGTGRDFIVTAIGKI